MEIASKEDLRKVRMDFAKFFESSYYVAAVYCRMKDSSKLTDVKFGKTVHAKVGEVQIL